MRMCRTFRELHFLSTGSENAFPILSAVPYHKAMSDMPQTHTVWREDVPGERSL